MLSSVYSVPYAGGTLWQLLNLELFVKNNQKGKKIRTWLANQQQSIFNPIP